MKVWVLYDWQYPANCLEVYASKVLADKSNKNPKMFMVESFEVIGWKRRRGKAKLRRMGIDRSGPRWRMRRGGP